MTDSNESFKLATITLLKNTKKPNALWVYSTLVINILDWFIYPLIRSDRNKIDIIMKLLYMITWLFVFFAYLRLNFLFVPSTDPQFRSMNGMHFNQRVCFLLALNNKAKILKLQFCFLNFQKTLYKHFPTCF